MQSQKKLVKKLKKKSTVALEMQLEQDLYAAKNIAGVQMTPAAKQRIPDLRLNFKKE